jgi:hypothetical protein
VAWKNGGETQNDAVLSGHIACAQMVPNLILPGEFLEETIDVGVSSIRRLATPALCNAYATD